MYQIFKDNRNNIMCCVKFFKKNDASLFGAVEGEIFLGE